MAATADELEARARARELWFAAALQSVGDAVIAADGDGTVRFMNPAAEKLTGHSCAEALGEQAEDVFALVDAAGTAVENVLRTTLRTARVTELAPNHQMARPNGRRAAVEAVAPLVVDEDGKVLGAVVVFRDSSDRKELEQRVAQAERLASIGAMAAGMAHEINNPLAYVITNVGLAIEGLEDALSGLRKPGQPPTAAAQIHELIDALRDANEGADRVRRIVHDLRKFARVDSSSIGVLDLADVLDAAAKMTANVVRDGARLRKEYGTTPLVEANEGQLTQVFSNILINAGQAIGEGRGEEQAIVISTCTDVAGQAIVEVSDTGPGMSADVLAHVFDPFFTTRADGAGMGLGLSICHSVIASLGGKITAESVVGRGTTFRVVLPPSRSSSTRTRAARPHSDALRRGKVLVVDDEPAVANSVARMLRAAHDVTVETDPRSALARMAKGEGYDVVFCDLMMPNMSGIEVYRAVAASAPDQAKRMVFMTGGAFSQSSQAFLETVGNISVAKPFSIDAIRSIVSDYVK